MRAFVLEEEEAGRKYPKTAYKPQKKEEKKSLSYSWKEKEEKEEENRYGRTRRRRVLFDTAHQKRKGQTRETSAKMDGGKKRLITREKKTQRWYLRERKGFVMSKEGGRGKRGRGGEKGEEHLPRRVKGKTYLWKRSLLSSFRQGDERRGLPLCPRELRKRGGTEEVRENCRP